MYGTRIFYSVLRMIWMPLVSLGLFLWSLVFLALSDYFNLLMFSLL